MPNLNAHGGADNHDVAATLGVQEVAKGFGDQQAPATGQLYLLMSGRQQSPQHLNLPCLPFQPSRSYLSLNELNPFIQLLLPRHRIPQAQATNSFFGKGATVATAARFAPGDHLLAHLQRYRHAITLV